MSCLRTCRTTILQVVIANHFIIEAGEHQLPLAHSLELEQEHFKLELAVDCFNWQLRSFITPIFINHVTTSVA